MKSVLRLQSDTSTELTFRQKRSSSVGSSCSGIIFRTLSQISRSCASFMLLGGNLIPTPSSPKETCPPLHLFHAATRL
jgi:hypothetical protein